MKVAELELRGDRKKFVVFTEPQQLADFVVEQGHELVSLVVRPEPVTILTSIDGDSPEQYLATLCQALGLAIDKVRSLNTRRFNQGRKIISYMLRRKLKLAYPEIGDLLHRDHSTIISNCKQIELGLAAGDTTYAELYEKVRTL